MLVRICSNKKKKDAELKDLDNFEEIYLDHRHH